MLDEHFVQQHLSTLNFISFPLIYDLRVSKTFFFLNQTKTDLAEAGLIVAGRLFLSGNAPESKKFWAGCCRSHFLPDFLLAEPTCTTYPDRHLKFGG